MTKDVCDPAIIISKFFVVYSSIKKYIASFSYIYNAIQEKNTNNSKKLPMGNFKKFIETLRKEYIDYKDVFEKHKNKMRLNDSEAQEVENFYKRLCSSSIIDKMMYTYKILATKSIDENGDWIVRSNTRVEPMKGVKISMLQMFNIDNAVVKIRSYQLHQAVDTFYNKYTEPNFNMDTAIETICGFLMKLHRSRKINCDLIPKYMRKVHNANIIDINEMNMAYLETNNKNTFILILMQDLLNVKTDEIKIDVKTRMQIKRLLAFVSKEYNNPKLASTLKAGTDLLNTMDE